MRNFLLILSVLCLAVPVGASEQKAAEAKARAVARGSFSPRRLPKGVTKVDLVHNRLTFKDGSTVEIENDENYAGLVVRVTKPVPGKQGFNFMHKFEADRSGAKIKLRLLGAREQAGWARD